MSDPNQNSIPPTVAEYIAKKNPQDNYATLQFAREIVKVWQERNDFMHENICSVCGNLLTLEEQHSLQPQMFSRTCNAHREYASFYDLTEARKKHNYQVKIETDQFKL